MGIYLVGVGAKEWFGEEEGDRGAVASALNRELRRRGLPPYLTVPEETALVRGSGQSFEEKLVPSMAGFGALCEARLSPEEAESLCGWTVLVPVPLDEDVRLPVDAGHDDECVIAGAPRVLALAERLAAAIDLPADIPMACDNLDLTTWFLDGAAKELAATRPGPWSEDLGTAFYVALFLRAAQHSIRRGCPIVYS
ncbi:hypothetical protein ACFXPI_19280 [Streptomyces sp. NPDC059104]|uniref:hypothetical protein n=1 Tax=Streptomyces sp. NPDC059104 TaxID=3346729 RepID=UPI0036B2063A